jgi:hypothetical protein
MYASPMTWALVTRIPRSPRTKAVPTVSPTSTRKTLFSTTSGSKGRSAAGVTSASTRVSPCQTATPTTATSTASAPPTRPPALVGPRQGVFAPLLEGLQRLWPLRGAGRQAAAPPGARRGWVHRRGAPGRRPGRGRAAAAPPTPRGAGPGGGAGEARSRSPASGSGGGGGGTEAAGRGGGAVWAGSSILGASSAGTPCARRATTASIRASGAWPRPTRIRSRPRAATSSARTEVWIRKPDCSRTSACWGGVGARGPHPEGQAQGGVTPPAGEGGVPSA